MGLSARAQHDDGQSYGRLGDHADRDRGDVVRHRGRSRRRVARRHRSRALAILARSAARPRAVGSRIGPASAMRRRGVFFTAGRRLIALDAATGHKVLAFGGTGEIEMPVRLQRRADSLRESADRRLEHPARRRARVRRAHGRARVGVRGGAASRTSLAARRGEGAPPRARASSTGRSRSPSTWTARCSTCRSPAPLRTKASAAIGRRQPLCELRRRARRAQRRAPLALSDGASRCLGLRLAGAARAARRRDRRRDGPGARAAGQERLSLRL